LPELNVLEFKTNLATDSSQWFSAQTNIENAKLRLKALLNIPAREAFDIVTPAIEKIPVLPLSQLQPLEVLALAKKNLPLIRVNDLRYKALEKRLEANKRAYYPTISLSGGLGTNYASNSFKVPVVGLSNNYNLTPLKVNIGGTDYFVEQPQQVVTGTRTIRPQAYANQLSQNFRQNFSVNVNVPIFNGGINKINKLRTQINMGQVVLAQEQANANLEQDIYKAYNDAFAAQQQYQASLQAESLAEKTFSLAQKRYELGLLNSFDISTAQNNSFTARLRKIYAQYDYVFKIKILEYYRGQGIILE
jgi:outer membrane protein